MAAKLRENDCFGAILRNGDGVFTFVSGESGKIYATLDRDGLHVQSKRPTGKEENVIPLKALKTLIAALEKDRKE